MQIFPQGPDYPFAHRWGARAATAMLTVPFVLVAYGLGYIVDFLLEEDPVNGGIVAVFLFAALLSATWVAQWFRPFTQ